MINGESLEMENSTVFLGVTLDCKLQWGAHIETLAGYGWALSWSVRSSWNSLTAPPPQTSAVDLRAFDGLRVLCMLCVIIEHVCWLGTLSYIADTRSYEQVEYLDKTRHAPRWRSNPDDEQHPGGADLLPNGQLSARSQTPHATAGRVSCQHFLQNYDQ
ncbi:jg16199 [Pararge aegeria aegeria]|uniref:Jg16199 protein n=1 Tax=Pararge aegeria aegeria TaxID=348720 RepID=A0A8S4RAK7_9NEOP|nr:jg16199 [Pararge aegeria aegeria]